MHKCMKEKRVYKLWLCFCGEALGGNFSKDFFAWKRTFSVQGKNFDPKLQVKAVFFSNIYHACDIFKPSENIKQ